MVKKFFILLFIFLFAIQFIYALDTSIKVKAPQFTEVHLTILKPGDQYEAYGSYVGYSNYYGDVNFTHSGDESVFDIMVVLKQNGARIFSREYDNSYSAGTTISIEAIPEGYEILETPSDFSTRPSNASTEESNITSNESDSEIIENTIVNTTEDSNFLGYVTSELPKKRGFSLSLYIIGAVLVLAIFLLIARQMMQQPSQKNIRVTKLSEFNQRNTYPQESEQREEADRLIAESEEKLKQAQADLTGLRREQRIREIKDQLRKDQEELRRLYGQE